MRFHKAESAFFVFIAVVFAAGLVVLHAYTRNAAALEAGVRWRSTGICSARRC
jgi:two-component system, cell cycle response regulator